MTTLHFTPKEWLMIDIASKAGMDKAQDGSTLDYATRLLWTLQNIDILESIRSTVKKPAQFIKAVLALRDTENGIPSGHMVNLDSASSGGQLLSTALRCETGMINTGVINSDKPPALYKTLTDTIQCPVPLGVAKLALMTYLYGSTAEPEKAFGDDVELFYQGATEVAPRACIFRDIAINAWQPFKDFHQWVMPNGNTVHKRVWQTIDTRVQVPNLDSRSFTFRHKVNKGKEFSVSLAADIVHSIDAYIASEMSARSNYDPVVLQSLLKRLECVTEAPSDRTKMCSLDTVVHIGEDLSKYDNNYLAQAKELIEYTLAYKPFPIMVTHDDFGCHPNNTQRMREHYNRLLWELYHSNIIQDILEQVTGVRYDQFPLDPVLADKILDADYPLN